MNEEIETLINNLEGCIGMFDYMLTPIESNLLLSYINELQQENKELHNKIDKAIEYINIAGIKTDKPKYFQMIKDTIWGKELLDILKDSDVDGE